MGVIEWGLSEAIKGKAEKRKELNPVGEEVWRKEVDAVTVLEVFFFQAEDGIRDPLWSRGLGNVYERQDLALSLIGSFLTFRVLTPVFYTHLTLPTILLV